MFSCKNCGKAYQADHNNIVEEIIYKDGSAICQCGYSLFKNKYPVLKVGFLIDDIFKGQIRFFKNVGYEKVKERTFVEEVSHSFLKLKFLGCKIYIITRKTVESTDAIRAELCKNKIVFDVVTLVDSELKSDVINSLQLDIFCYGCNDGLSLDCPNTKLIQLTENDSISDVLKTAICGHGKCPGSANIETNAKNQPAKEENAICCTCLGMWDCPSDKIVAVCFGKECQLYRKIG